MAKQVTIKTSKGDITVELNETEAPISSANFSCICRRQFSLTARSSTGVIPDFMIQCGGFSPDMTQKGTKKPIKNEADNGLKNERGTLAMARTNDPDSATSQFFINHKDNSFLDYAGKGNPGYAVFAKVTEGMDVVDAIAAVKTDSKGFHDDVPLETVEIVSAAVV